MSQDFSACDSLAALLLAKADENDDDQYRAKALYYLGTYRYSNRDIKESHTSLLDSALTLTEDRDAALRSSIYTSKGIWETRDLNYRHALTYLEKALEYARAADNPKLEASAELNIAEVYRFLNDTLGFVHTRRLLDYAKRNNLHPLLQTAAFYCADNVSKTSRDSADLIPYTGMLDTDEIYRQWSTVFKARVDFNRGRPEEAWSRLEGMDRDMYAYIEPNMLKAKLLNATGRYAESNGTARKTLGMYSEINQDYNWPDLYRLMADNYNALGRGDSTVKYLRLYVNAHDSIQRIIKDEQINAYRIKYEVGKKEQELQVSKARTAKLTAIATTTGAFFIAVLVFVFIYIRHQNSYCKKIVEQNKDAIRRENDLIGKIEDLSGSQQGPSAEKSSEVFRRIMHEMDRNRIWSSLTVTRDSFADLVGCNRTYFSQIIKNHTGMSFTQFMNKRRINEAVKILSDPDTNVTFDLLSKDVGFVSESTFYTSFKHIMGMTPATYRKMATSEQS